MARAISRARQGLNSRRAVGGADAAHSADDYDSYAALRGGKKQAVATPSPPPAPTGRRGNTKKPRARSVAPAARA
jgi:hypothetical protein